MNNTQLANFNDAIHLLTSGTVIAFPTETFYGLGVSPSSAKGVDALIALKERSELAGIPVIIDSQERVEEWIAETNSTIRSQRKKIQEVFWPGPLTLVIATNSLAQNFLCRAIFGASFSLALRLSSSETARTLASALGGAITATSANRKGFPPASSAAEVAAYFPEMFVLEDMQHVHEKLPSTILDVRTLPFRIIREGAITADKLQQYISHTA